jgi:hypothetical protein
MKEMAVTKKKEWAGGCTTKQIVHGEWSLQEDHIGMKNMCMMNPSLNLGFS